jgi:hypothetical protein
MEPGLKIEGWINMAQPSKQAFKKPGECLVMVAGSIRGGGKLEQHW